MVYLSNMILFLIKMPLITLYLSLLNLLLNLCARITNLIGYTLLVFGFLQSLINNLSISTLHKFSFHLTPLNLFLLSLGQSFLSSSSPSFWYFLIWIISISIAFLVIVAINLNLYWFMLIKTCLSILSISTITLFQLLISFISLFIKLIILFFFSLFFSNSKAFSISLNYRSVMKLSSYIDPFGASLSLLDLKSISRPSLLLSSLLSSSFIHFYSSSLQLYLIDKVESFS